MLRFQIALVILLVSCIAFLSCGRVQDMLEDPVPDEMPEMSMEMVMEMMAEHESWDHVMLPAPTMTIEEAAAVMNPGGTGQAHGTGTRTVYFNEDGAMANRAGVVSPAEYPVGTMIVKDAMDAMNTFIMMRVTMTKTDDPMYEAYNGWMYGATQRASATDELGMPQTVPMEVAASCHGCHAKAANDSVFVSLDKEVTTMDDTTMDDTTMDDTTMDDTTMDDTTMDDTTMDDTTMDDTTMDDTTMDDTTMDDTTMDDTTMDDTTMDDTTMDDTTMDDTTMDDTTGNGDDGNGNGNGGGQ